MTTPQESPLCFASPKRKRDSDDSLRSSPSFSPTISRVNTNPEEFPFPNTDDGGDIANNGSPRSAVATRLHSLDLQEPVIRQLDFLNNGGRARKRFAQMGNGEQVADAAHTDGAPSERCDDIVAGVSATEADFSLSSMDEDTAGENSRLKGDKGLSTIKDKPQARRHSPPFDGDPRENPLTWHDSEITGHDPSDPNDDGYGINGIGFKPTPAIAWARSQRRKQQVAEYKSRESKEARQRRSQRRKADGQELGFTISKINFDPSEAKMAKKELRVRFDDAD